MAFLQPLGRLRHASFTNFPRFLAEELIKPIQASGRLAPPSAGQGTSYRVPPPPYQNEHSCLPVRMLGPPGKVPTRLKNAFFYLPGSKQDPKSRACMGAFCLLGLSCSRPVLCPVFRPLTAEDICYSSGKMTVLPAVSLTCVWLPITRCV